MQTALANTWCNPTNLVVKEVNFAMFNISMDIIEDHKHILKGSPWLFINFWLILQ